MIRTVVIGAIAVCVALSLIGCTALLPPSNALPVASFSMTPTSGDAPLEVSFDAGGSYDSDGQIVSYSWNFGDGATAQGVIASHIYSSPGYYSVRLAVRDNDGATDGLSRGVQVAQQTTASYRVTVGSITDEFEQNEYAATLKYEGKFIAVSGYIRSIGIDLRDQPYVALVASPSDSTFDPGVNCYFEEEGPHPGLANLRTGDHVTVVAEFSSYSSLFDTVYLELGRIE